MSEAAVFFQSSGAGGAAVGGGVPDSVDQRKSGHYSVQALLCANRKTRQVTFIQL